MTNRSCCKECVPPKRHPGCHGKCPEYQAEKEEREKLKEAIRSERLKESAIDGYEVSRTRERKKKYKKG